MRCDALSALGLISVASSSAWNLPPRRGPLALARV
jgi:hypothetical protein